MGKGGIIGKPNNPTLATTSGVWSLQEQYQAKRASTWPTSLPISDGLALYLDAAYYTGGTTWLDQSGNDRDFNWVTTPTYVSGSLPYFSTLENRCVGPASNSFGINNTSGYTIFLIMMQNELVSTGAFKFYKNNLSGAPGRGIFSHCTWSDDVVYFDQGGCCDVDTRTSVSSGGSTSWNFWTCAVTSEV